MNNNNNNNIIKQQNILDKGHIIILDTMGTDVSIINAAKISYNKHMKHKKLVKTDKNLLDHMAKNGHWTPFSHVSVQLHIKMPIFIARQWFKSSIGFSRNEVSRRYINNEPEFYLPNYLITDTDKKTPDNTDFLLNDIDLHFQKSLRLYDKLITEDITPGQAKIILPQSMYTEFIETGTLAAYARLYKLRITQNAQFEIQEYAKGLDKLLKNIFPEAWKVLKKYTETEI